MGMRSIVLRTQAKFQKKFYLARSVKVFGREAWRGGDGNGGADFDFTGLMQIVHKVHALYKTCIKMNNLSVFL